MKSLSCVRLFATPWTVAYQAPPSMRFSRQEYWRGLPFPSPASLFSECQFSLLPSLVNVISILEPFHASPILGLSQAVSISALLYAEYIMRNAGMEEAQAGIKIAGRNNNNLRYADDPNLMAESQELKNLSMKAKEESQRVGLKLNIQKTKIMASGPITSWQIDRETIETETDFIWEAPKSLQMVTAVMKLKDTYSLEEKL